MNKPNLYKTLSNYVDPVDKYGEDFLDFNMSLGDERENPLKILELFDTVPMVYDYFVSLETHVEEELNTYTEEMANLEADIRETVEAILISERNLPASKTPTEASIKARARILFNKFVRKNIDTDEDTIKKYYTTVLSFMESDSERDDLVDTLWDFMVEFHGLYHKISKLKSYYKLIHGRTNALKMKKDTLIESARLIKDVVSKGLSVYDMSTRGNVKQCDVVPDSVDLDLSGDYGDE